MTEMDPEFKEILDCFFIESIDMLASFEKQLMILEEHEDRSSILNEIFRIAHSLKGATVSMGFKEASDFAHKVEDLLVHLRNNPALITSEMISLLLESSDALKTGFESLKQNNESPWPARPDLLKRFQTIKHQLESKESLVANPPSADNHPIAPISVTSLGAQPSQRNSVISVLPLKVRPEQIDHTLELVGELAMLKSQAVQSLLDPRQMTIVMNQIEKGIREIHSQIQDMKKSPVEPLVQKLNRVVRDTSQKLGKEIKFVWDERITGLEKSVMDIITDPLVHMVRNSCDHGVELPHERLERGKPSSGQIKITIEVEPNQVEFIIDDDGKGIDPQFILKKAKEKGIVDDHADQWSASEMIKLLFSPGFSTASEVTEFSGRGVGLDVVRTNVESTGGSVTASSEIGVGTRFKFLIPVRNGLTEALLMKLGEWQFLTPLQGILRIIRFKESQAMAVDTQQKIYRDGNEIYTLLELGKLINVPHVPSGNIGIVARTENGLICFRVDHVGSKGQFMVKPLGEFLDSRRGIIGMAVLGEGTPVPVIDFKRLLNKTKTAA